MADRVVAAVVRHREALLGCRDAAAGGSLVLPTAPASEDDPEAALRALLGELCVASPAVERRGPSIELSARDAVPFLVTVQERAVTATDACPDPTWILPSALVRQGDDGPWRAYDAVAPTVESVAGDTERGSTAIATDALWVLRDGATGARTDGGLEGVEAIASALLDARPTMAALANRVNRAMAGAESPAEIERAATDGLVRAFGADEAAARLAAETVAGGRVLTLSRSGTVQRALLAVRPSVEVLASRPGGEGQAIADELAAAGLTVTTHPDAAVYDRLRSGDIDAVLVGADAVTPDGGVVNKVGTRAAALAAALAGVPCFAVCASDKVWPAPADGPIDPPVDPPFDLTPPELVTAVLTERGRLSSGDVADIASQHRALSRWR